MTEHRKVTAQLTVQFQGHTYDLSHIPGIKAGEIVDIESTEQGNILTLTTADYEAIAAKVTTRLQQEFGGLVVKRKPRSRTPEQKAAFIAAFKAGRQRAEAALQERLGHSATPYLGECHKSHLAQHKHPECKQAHLAQGAGPVPQKQPAMLGLKPVGKRLVGVVQRFLSAIFRRRS